MFSMSRFVVRNAALVTTLLVCVSAAPVAAQTVWVANRTSDTVTAIDATTKEVVATVPVGSYPRAVAVSADGRHVFVGSANASAIAVIDSASRTVVHTIPGAAAPVDIVIGGAVGFSSRGVWTGGVDVLDVGDPLAASVTGTVCDSADPTVCTAGTGDLLALALSGDGARLYAGTYMAGLLVIDTATLAVVARVPGTGAMNTGVAAHPDGTRIYVTGSAPEAGFTHPAFVYVVDAATDAVVKTIPAGGYLMDAALSPDGSSLYVTDGTWQRICRIDTATDELAGCRSLPEGRPHGVMVRPDGAEVWVTLDAAGQVLVLTPALAATSIATIPVGSFPAALAFASGNQPPVAAPTGGGTYELLDPIALGGQVSDPDGDLVSYEWQEAGQVLVQGSVQTVAGGEPVTLPSFELGLDLGSHTLTLVVSDGVAPPVSAAVIVHVIDTTAPTISLVPGQTILWPPDHGLVTVVMAANVADAGYGGVSLSVAVSSDEPEDGLGDGDVGPDWTEPVVDGSNGITVQLRAERGGSGDGRTYRIEVTATDASGNASTAALEVVVPHDRRR